MEVRKIPSFMVKRKVFEWIRSGKKTVELRKGKAKSGEKAVFVCGPKILRGKITDRKEDNLSTILQSVDFKKIMPTANSVKDVEALIKDLYGTTEGTFTAYKFTMSQLDVKS